MRRLLVIALLATLSLTTSAAAEKRRAVGPSNDRCMIGRIDFDVFADSIALDATHVYFLDSFENELYRVPKNGGTRQLLATFPDEFVIHMTVDEANVYVSAIPASFGSTLLPGSIYAVTKTGGAPRTLASGVHFPVKIVFDATHVYWVSVGTVDLANQEVMPDGKIERVRKDSSDRQTLAGSLSAPLSLAIDDTHVYFSESGEATGNGAFGLRRVAKTGGTIQTIANTVAGEMEIVGPDVVFFGAISAQSAGIVRLPKTGGIGQVLVIDDQIFVGPRIIDGQVYYATIPQDPELMDVIMRVPLGGGTPQYLFSPDLSGEDFEVDSCGIVFGNTFGELRRVER